MKPTIGRIVHYKSCDGKDYAAMVVKTMEGRSLVSLVVFKEVGISFRLTVEEGNEPGQWHWPPRTHQVSMGVAEAENKQGESR